MLNAELKILAGKYQGKAIPLTTKRFLVGREQDCQLRPNSELVSRHHCVFITDDYAVRLRDLGSTNGTRVNGDLVRGEIVLNAGDRVTIGRLEVELVVRKPSATPAKAPSGVPANVGLASAGTSGEMPAVGAPIETAPTNAAQSNETSIEISTQAASPSQDQTPTVANIGGDTAIIPGATGGPMVPLAATPQMMPMGFPMGYGFPMQGQMPGYSMPGYGYAMPQGYPMPMPGMPMMPGYPMPQAPAAEGTSAAGAATVAEPPVRLPDPNTTGVKAPASAPSAPTAQQPAASTPEATPSTSAADLIKPIMQQRSATN
jgi:pSer/pThr/pTyr-binding forkhead associated (FHA) protein